MEGDTTISSLKPNWLEGIHDLFSARNLRRFWISLSKILQRVEVNKMGRNLSELAFATKFIRVSPQESGKLKTESIKLKRDRRNPLARSDRKTPKPTPSKPRAERALQKLKAAENSRSENGQFIRSASSTSVIPGQTSSSLRALKAGESGSVRWLVRESAIREERDLNVL